MINLDPPDRMPVTAVTLGSHPEPVIRGQLWHSGPDWVVMIHDVGQDLDTWSDLPAVLAADGYSVLAIDLPGHGLSDEPWHPTQIVRAVATAAAFATREGAASRHLLAAGSTAVPSMIAARDLVSAVVALSPRLHTNDILALREVRVPALILTGSSREQATEEARRIFQGKAGWTVLSTFGAADDGPALLAGSWGFQVREQILTFLRDYRSDSASGIS